MALCPVHEAEGRHNASLHVWEEGGQVAWHCFAGCDHAAVGEALGIERRNGSDPHWTPEGCGPAVGEYRYVDEQGHHLFTVVRTADKQFPCWRPDSSSKTGKRWSMESVRRVLYHLPQVIWATNHGQTVYVAEGEKDADNLRAAGVTATCNPGGAGKWRPEYSESLRGANVAVVRDKDEPGRRHADAVAASLAPLAASVRVVEAAVGKDASDHLAAGKTIEEFVSVGGGAAVVSLPPDDAAPRPPCLKLVPMAEVVPVPVEWLWDARLPRGKLAVVAGDPGLGKSYLTLKMAAIISTGGEWPDGSRATAGDVLIVSAEDDAADTIRPRLDRLGADVSRVTLIDGVLNGGEFARPFSLRLDVNLLRTAIVDTSAALVIVDPLNAFLGGIDSHKAAEVRGVKSPLAHVAGETHAAILAVHHLNKGTSSNALYRASGSLDFVAAARIVHGVAPDPEIEGRRIFVPVKCNIAAMPDGIGFRIGEDGVTFDNLPVTVDAAAAFTTRSVNHEERSERDMARDFIRAELADGPVPVTVVFKIAKDNGFSEKTVCRAGADLHVHKKKQGYQGPWFWSLADDPEVSKVVKESKDGRVSDVATFDTFADGRPSDDPVGPRGVSGSDSLPERDEPEWALADGVDVL